MPDVQGAPQQTGSGFVPMMGNVSNFGFMQNPALMDPGMQQAMMRQQYAQSLMSLGTETTPLRSPWQAAARAVQGLLGGVFSNQATDLLQQYAEGSRKALGEAYSQQPIPQLPAAPPLGGSGGAATAPGAPVTAATPGAVDAASLVPKEQARQMIIKRESDGQNVFSKIPPPPGYPADSVGSGFYQFIPSTWAEGQKLAGIPPAQQTRLAIDAPRDIQDKVFDAVYEKYGVAPWRQSSATTYVHPSSSVGMGDVDIGALRASSDQAAQYGISLAQQYRQMAINAAQSPYAAVRAMAPQYQAQSISYAGYGRFTPVGTNSNGALLMMDRQTGEVKEATTGAQVHTDPRTGALITSSGGIVAPGLPSVGGDGVGSTGGPAGTGTVGNVPLARQSGVPVAPGNPYAGLSTPDQQKALLTDRTEANKEVAAGDEEATAAKDQMITLGRMQQIVAAHPEWVGTGPKAGIARHWASFNNDPLYQEFQNLQAQLLPATRMGTGITRVTNKDMDIFGIMTPHLEMDGTAMNNALQARIRQANLTLEANRFQHDYVDANGSLRGAPSAWDSYMAANPIFTQDKNGNFVPNANWQTHRAWFQANTDPKTGLLLEGSRAVTPNQPPVRGGQAPSQDPTKYPNFTAHGSDGSTWFSDGKKWTQQ